MWFSLDITTIPHADVAEMDTYAEVVVNSGLVVRDSLKAEGSVLSGLTGENAVPVDIRTVLSDHVQGVHVTRAA